MTADYPEVDWDERLEEDCRTLIESAILEDLENQLDWTTIALVDDEATATAHVVARSPGVLAGIRTVDLVLETTQADLQWQPAAEDGERLRAGQIVGTLSGNARDLLTLERTMLNFLGPLCGIATLTAQFVAAVAGTKARVYDTRKTTPGWRRLEKYAVRCGGGHNHRLGLYAGVMIKDNHLAFWTAQDKSLAAAIPVVRQMLASAEPRTADDQPLLVEVEVDSLSQLRDVLPAQPDIVLLDNMSLDQLTAAVALRNELAPQVELEASGGVNLRSIGEIARTGVERISSGALTHSATSLDVALDWAHVPAGPIQDDK
ncbi:MAG: carboxylating nicotinate-nucleotide diphosphorylase [Pirellulales bacterium]